MARVGGARRIRRLRDRRGRGLRGRLAPAELPISRTRAERFDDVVVEAVTHLEARWADELASVEFAVEEVPPDDGDALAVGDDPVPDDPADPMDLLEDPVPLSRLQPASGTGHSTTPTRIVLYRRPLEARALDGDDLVDLVLDVLVHEVARLLGVDEGVVDPEGHSPDDED